MKKLLTIISISALFIFLSFIIYKWFIREKKYTPGTERCIDCALIDNDTLQRMVGTVEIDKNGKWLFTDRLTNLTYNLTPCDFNCGREEVNYFDKINLKDPATQKQLYFDIEGKYSRKKNELMYKSVISLGKRIFLNIKKTKEATFDHIRERHTPLEEQTFLLKESHYAGLRSFLPHYFNKQQLKLPIPIKEATWETGDSTLITIWFQQKQNLWQPIEHYEWRKGTEF